MKNFRRTLLAACGFLSLLMAVGSAWAADASDLFLQAYQEYQAGEHLERDGNLREAIAKYKIAAKVLEEITRTDPSWNPPVVELRLRKSRERIDRIAALPPSAQEPPEGPLPQADPTANIPLPDVNTSRAISRPRPDLPSAQNPTYQQRSNSASVENSSLRQQLAAAQKDVDRWQEKFSRQSAELKSALFEVDKTKVTVVELKARVAQAQDAFENAVKDREIARAKTRPPDDKRTNELAARIEKIEADNEVLLEENSRLVAKLESAAKYIVSADDGRKTLDSDRRKILDQRNEALAKAKRIKDNAATIERLDVEKGDLEKKFAKEKRDLEAKLAEANSPERIRKLEQQNKKLSGQLDASAKKFAEAEKNRASETAQRISKIEADYDALQEENTRLVAKLESASKYIVATNEGRKILEDDRKKIAAQRDALAAKNTKLDAHNEVLLDENNRLFVKLESASKYIAAADSARNLLEVDRRTLIAKRDEALAAAKKLATEKKDLETKRTAGPNSERMKKLEADNKRLEEAVEAADRELAELKKRPDDKAIADLRSQMNGFADQLITAQSQISIRDDQLKKLAAQLDEATGEVARLKLNPEPTAEEKHALSENDLLRGIILRQIKEQSERDNARVALEKEIQTLQVKSDTISKQLEVLARPAFKLSDQEALLFNEPVALLSASGNSTMNVSMAFSKPGVKAGAKGGQKSEATQPKADPDDLTKESRELIEQARQLFNDRQFDEAEKIYQKLASATPNNSFVLTNLGVTQIQAKKLAAAEVALKKAVSISAKDSFALTNLGIVYCKRAHFEEAIATLKEAIALNDKNHVALNYLGICYGEKGLTNEAEDCFKRSIAVRDDYPDAHFNLAVLYVNFQPPAIIPAKEQYKKAINFGSSTDSTLDRLLK